MIFWVQNYVKSCFLENNVKYFGRIMTTLVLENVKEVEVPLLERLYNNNQITLDIKNEVEGLVKKKKPSKKEKEQLFTILRGVYVRNNFEANDLDSKKVIEQKENEIKALLKL